MRRRRAYMGTRMLGLKKEEDTCAACNKKLRVCVTCVRVKLSAYLCSVYLTPTKTASITSPFRTASAPSCAHPRAHG